MKFIWDAKYSVGIKSIDHQHQKFFEICNEIDFLIHRGQTDQNSLNKIIRELFAYAEDHMTFEEKYFKEFNYPDAQTHIAAHDFFRQKVKQLHDATEIADFARDWLSGHILAVDQKFSQFFIVHDLK
ncbi:MAG: bacteriohemerythrin [Candidatus Shapirobacteria bacterium]|nr:bacteriohemerythrin [Candidatus Shapirobacteria bacterium]